MSVCDLENKTVMRACPLCGSSHVSALHIDYAPEEWPLRQCVSCKMVYLAKTWSMDVLYEDFSWEKSVEAEDQKRTRERGFSRKLSKIIRRIRNASLPRKNAANLIMQYCQSGNVLDVGCGVGFHLNQLSDTYTPYGIEISKEAVEKGGPVMQSKGGGIVNNDALGGMKTFDENFFTGIIMRSFLEHDVNPLATLSEGFRILKPGGVIVIKVPNYACLNRIMMGRHWCGFRFPEHVNYFTPSSIREMVLKTGLTIKRFNPMDRFFMSDNMWLLCEKPR